MRNRALPNETKVCILGGTGTSGRAVAEALVTSGITTRVVTRNPSGPVARRLATLGCDIAEADLFNSASVDAGLRGCDTVYLAGASKADKWNSGEAVQGMIAIDAALSVGVSHFIYQSALVDDACGVLGNGSKRAIEERLAELDLRATILRPAIFMDNLLTHSRPRCDEAGQLIVAMALPLDLARGFVSVDDIGRAAARIVHDAEALGGRSYDLVGDDLSLADIARTLGELIGKPVLANPVSLEKIELVSKPVAAVYRWLSERHGGESRDDLVRLIGQPARFREWSEKYLLPAIEYCST